MCDRPLGPGRNPYFHSSGIFTAPGFSQLRDFHSSGIFTAPGFSHLRDTLSSIPACGWWERPARTSISEAPALVRREWLLFPFSSTSRPSRRAPHDTGSAGYFLVIGAVGFCDGGGRLGVCHFHYIGGA